MSNKTLIALAALVIPVLSLAQADGKYQCTFGELVRRVEILTEPGVSVPCEVHYYKDTEAPGETQVLWSAQSQAGYCQSQTEAFISRLEGWGWNCGQGESMPADDEAPVSESEAMPSSAPMPGAEADRGGDAAPAYDDTDVLSPGDPSE